jgi:hypothetical protein
VIGSGGRKPPYTWTAGSVPVPAGLQLTSDGNLAGKFSSAGSHLFDVVVTDATRKSARLPLRIDIEFAAALPPADALRFATSETAIIRPQVYEPAFRNPLAGFRSGVAAIAKNHPFASLARQYIEWNLIENSENDTVRRA